MALASCPARQGQQRSFAQDAPGLELGVGTLARGAEPGVPQGEAIVGCGILAQGRMHVAAIRDTGSLIIGQRDLELDGLTGLREISHRADGRYGSMRAAGGSARQPGKNAAPCR